MQIKSLAIFCGSKNGGSQLYQQHAAELGKILADNNIALIYGGGKRGLMGCVADHSMQNGGIVRGVIPRLLMDWEHQHEDITELLIVEDMHQRKRKLYELCDAAIILPGGFGTLDELFEMLTWNQLAIHDKKIFILNSGNFYQHLLQHLHLLAREGFLYGNLNEQLTILNEPKELLQHLNH
jgi:uncharacterized protein (TIGR00730 family)